MDEKFRGPRPDIDMLFDGMSDGGQIIGNPLEADQDPDPVLWEQLGKEDIRRVDPQILAIQQEIIISRLDELFQWIVQHSDYSVNTMALFLPINTVHFNMAKDLKRGETE